MHYNVFKNFKTIYLLMKYEANNAHLLLNLVLVFRKFYQNNIIHSVQNCTINCIIHDKTKYHWSFTHGF